MERDENREPWLGVQAAAEYLACSSQRIYTLVSEGRLQAGRDGRRLLFRAEWLDAIVEDARRA